ncbi:MAG: hypothetical protein ACJAT2_003066 [Bacteriovoracaceae bacterium]|jgi:hypothetical protein
MRFFFTLLFPFVLFAQTEANKQVTSKTASSVIHESLVELKNLQPEDFDKRIDDYRNGIEKYIEKKKRVCNGEFTTIILSDSMAKPDQEVKKLSKEEKQLCFNELKAIYKTYINHLFLVRTRFVEHLNEKRIKELALIRDATLKSIDSTFNRKR